MEKKYYSLRTGQNPKANGFEFGEFRDLFIRLYHNLDTNGYFSEAFGFICEDAGLMKGKVTDPEYEILVKIRKRNIWPIEDNYGFYTEDDLFDVIEFLYEHISKPMNSTSHGWNSCCVHWNKFNKSEGQKEFCNKINEIFDLYVNPFSLSNKGEILQKPEKGFEKIFEAIVPSNDENIQSRIESATTKFRRYKASLDDRRQAVRDLADILEYLRPKLQTTILTKKDETELFNIANNFGIRHLNDKQKTNYDAAVWLSWMFYHYLATIHVALRKIE
jgi:hypothetical protein